MMGYNPLKHHRRSTRLETWDYSRGWWYFVTICTLSRECILGDIRSDVMSLCQAGKIAEGEWKRIPNQFPSVELDDFVIMPNHIHGIIILNNNFLEVADSNRRGLINQTPTKDWILMNNPVVNLGKVVRAFKARTSRLIHRAGCKSSIWQRGYYDHIIRNEADLHRIREYIANNPLKWKFGGGNTVSAP